MTETIIIYYIAVNVIAFAMYGADKYFAKKDMWRISEKALIGIAAIGGAFGAFAGMETFRHKTKHAKFKIFVPVLMAVHLGVLAYLFAE
ncbi:MAG: DUF1294 domain-containing protein [Oscillospiraceae bacterium]|nr:DUF1294 domain-containing protein [Oscillospiraceae bacterium]MBR3952630.1 DUF1294 domain-containing protein [Oscillospiraceae bacterium]